MNDLWWLVLIPTSIIAAIALGGALIAVGKWIGSVNTDRSNFSKFMTDVRDDLSKIKESVARIFERIPERAVASASPMTLTDLGNVIAEELAAKAWARGLSDQLLAEVAGKRAFQVDEFAEEYVQNRLTPDWDQRVRESAYQHGLRRSNILNVLRVVLRDELLRAGTFPGPEDRPE